MQKKIAFALMSVIGLLVAYTLLVQRRINQKGWHEIYRRQVVDTSLDIAKWRAIKWTGQQVSSDLVKADLEGEFVADSPVILAVMNQENFDRMQQNYPPIFLATYPPGHIEMPKPPDGAWLVFMQRASHAPDQFPTTGMQLGLYLMKSWHEANLPPSHVTAELDLVVRTFTTARNVQKVKDALAATQKRHEAVQEQAPKGEPLFQGSPDLGSGIQAVKPAN